ncbi:hypothetical protein NMY22_g2972 [Coprinellus aureogranulatus]|nr:hypothetical protein NMY22_g2972 [Coprinellus aureogranulatus]
MASVRLDDRHPSIQYSGTSEVGSGQWQSVDDPAAFNGTITSATSVGATARVVFEGTKIEVYGSILQGVLGRPATSLYTLDDGDTVRYTGMPSDANQTQVLFYSSPNFAPGTHDLLIRNEVADGQLNLDYFLLWPSPKRAVPVGAVVGAVIGSVAFMTVTILAVVCLWRRGRKRRLTVRPPISRKVRQSSPDTPEKRLPSSATWAVVTPFEMTPHPASTSNLQVQQPLLVNSTDSLPSTEGLSSTHTGTPTSNRSPLTTPSTPSSLATAPTSNPSGENRAQPLTTSSIRRARSRPCSEKSIASSYIAENTDSEQFRSPPPAGER